MADFDVQGLSEFQNRMFKALTKKNVRYDELRLKVGDKILENGAKEVEEVSGRLKDSFLKRPYVDKKGVHKEWVLDLVGKDVIRAGSSVYYGIMVEEGHFLIKIKRYKDKAGRTRRKKELKGFVPGKHYFRKAVERTYSQLPDLVKDFLKQYGKEAGFDVSS